MCFKLDFVKDFSFSLLWTHLCHSFSRFWKDNYCRIIYFNIRNSQKHAKTQQLHTLSKFSCTNRMTLIGKVEQSGRKN